ncbi:DUF7718 family protein [[Mycobacterium] zoologicum]|uniref:DUF7718 family protein n=1 Tax=[Mycobacterium] zoologicum TaxID=2872311 RepID=UPI002CA17BB1|nr:hypothetical protein [Mycolicibacter sp. MYC101]MEB3063861.1 hypothetical protein [Mycolicibacter sp. MYC101]
MVRRGQQRRKHVERARRDLERQLDSKHGTYRPPPRGDCFRRQWETAYDDVSAIRVQFIIWRDGGRLVDFVVNVQVLGSGGWETVERFDCCHGHCHLHPQNEELPPESIQRLDAVGDVQRAFAQVNGIAHERARIIRDGAQ